MIAGDRAPVEAAAAAAKEAGARRCIPLKVSGPFHTSLLKPAGDALRERLSALELGAMRVPVLFNTLGCEKAEGDSLWTCLSARCSRPCVWKTPSAAWPSWA